MELDKNEKENILFYLPSLYNLNAFCFSKIKSFNPLLHRQIKSIFQAMDFYLFFNTKLI